MPDMPAWDIPDNLDELLEDEEGMWEDDRWEPILLTVMTGTVYQGRKIPYSCQIEFEPEDERLEAQEIEPDGYHWGRVIHERISETHPALADQLHLEDCEAATCVVWVESEETCRLLMEATWKLMFGE